MYPFCPSPWNLLYSETSLNSLQEVTWKAVPQKSRSRPLWQSLFLLRVLDIALTTRKPFSTSTKWPPLFPLYRGRYQLRRFPGSPYFSEPEAVQGACPLLSWTDCMAPSWRPATPLPGVQGQGWVGPFPLVKVAVTP